MTFGAEKLEWLGYPTVKKFEDTFIRFHVIHERDGRHTDTQTPHDDIGRAYASHRAAKITLCYASGERSHSDTVS